MLDELRGLSATKVIVLNKCDNGMRFSADLLSDFAHVVTLSAKSGDVSALREVVEGTYLSDGISLREDAVVANARQYAALKRAEEGLAVAIRSLESDVPMDAACIDAELAMQALSEVDGRAVDETIISSIFAHFCVGK